MLPQVTFRGVLPSNEVIELVQKKAKKLSEVAPLLHGCHVVIDAGAGNRGKDRPLRYSVSLHLSGGRDPHVRSPRHSVHENLHVALGEVFRCARRQLDARAKHRRGPSAQLRVDIAS